MGWCKKDVTPLLAHWSYVFLAPTHRYKVFIPLSEYVKIWLSSVQSNSIPACSITFHMANISIVMYIDFIIILEFLFCGWWPFQWHLFCISVCEWWSFQWHILSQFLLWEWWLFQLHLPSQFLLWEWWLFQWHQLLQFLICDHFSGPQFTSHRTPIMPGKRASITSTNAPLRQSDIW